MAECHLLCLLAVLGLVQGQWHRRRVSYGSHRRRVPVQQNANDDAGDGDEGAAYTVSWFNVLPNANTYCIYTAADPLPDGSDFTLSTELAYKGKAQVGFSNRKLSLGAIVKKNTCAKTVKLADITLALRGTTELHDAPINTLGLGKTATGVTWVAMRDTTDGKASIPSGTNAITIYAMHADGYPNGCEIYRGPAGQTLHKVGLYELDNGGSATDAIGSIAANVTLEYRCDGAIGSMTKTTELTLKTANHVCAGQATQFSMIGKKGSTDYPPEVFVVNGGTCPDPSSGLIGLASPAAGLSSIAQILFGCYSVLLLMSN